MGRKPNVRTSASSAAAAANATAPAFTSFAAATAHALRAYPNANASSSSVQAAAAVATAWDTAALQILKKLSKRDATTRTRALADLTVHIQSASLDEPGLGSAFVAAWGPAFRSVVQEDSSSVVRAAALSLMSVVVAKFRRLTVPILPHVLPVWLGARGDLSTTVCEAATESLNEALPSPSQRSKLVTRYAADLRSYCEDILTRLASDSDRDRFLPDARRVIAVLRWLLDAAQSVDPLSGVIDADSNPLQLLAKGPKQRKKNMEPVQAVGAMRDVCELASHVLEYMKVEVPADECRSLRFADMALLGMAQGEPAAWDLVLVLLRGGWTASFPDNFKKLADTVCRQATSAVPTGLSALLPLLHSLPAKNAASASLAVRVLGRMRDKLLPSQTGDRADSSQSIAPPGASYTLTTLPAYIECSSFVHTVGCTRWLEDVDDPNPALLRDAMLSDHIAPTLELYLSGSLPPVSKLRNDSVRATSDRQRNVGKGTARFSAEPAVALASAVCGMSEWQVSVTFPKVAKALITALNSTGSFEILKRYETFFDGLVDATCARALAASVIHAAVEASSDKYSEQNLGAVSVTLTKKASCELIEDICSDPERTTSSSLAEVVTYAKNALTRLSGQGDLSKPSEVTQYIGGICSWVYWACHFMKAPDPWNNLLGDIRSICTTDEGYYVIGETVKAHKCRREEGQFSAWTAMRGELLESFISDAASDMVTTTTISACVSILGASADATGGADVSVDVVARITNAIISKITSDNDCKDIDSLILVLMGSPTVYLERIENTAEFAAIAVLRAARSTHVLHAAIGLLERFPLVEKVAIVRKAWNVVHDRLTKASKFITTTETTLLAAALAQFMGTVGDSDIEGAVSLSSLLLNSWVSVRFLVAFMKSIPLSYVFGSESGIALDCHRYLDFYEKLACDVEHCTDEAEYAGVIDALEEFLKNVSVSEKTVAAGLAARRFLSESHYGAREVLRIVCNSSPADSSVWPPFQEVARQVLKVVNFKEPSESDLLLSRVPIVVLTVVEESRGACLESLKEALYDALKLIRRDPVSSEAKLAIDALSASLSRVAMDDGRSRVTLPSWLLDVTTLALRSIRKCLERSHTISAVDLQALETHGAILASNALQTYSPAELGEDDLRFWSFRAKDTLEFFLRGSSRKRGISSEGCRRLSCVSKLSSTLVSIGSAGTSRADTLDEVCHLGSWAGVLALPLTESAQQEEDGDDARIMVRKDSTGLCHLIVKAAERSVLLDRNGSIPVDRESVYFLVPLLSSRSSLTRKAVLILLSHAAAVDLPDVVASAFPDNGFSDEAEEIKFVTNLVPEPLRTCLKWQRPREGDGEEAKTANSPEEELGYFLTWRLFLDLVRPADAVSSSALLGDVGEDVSFRRVGISFLRANPELYAEFFGKCIEVVVDGNTTERTAAGAAAAEALEAEERAAQGLQLVLKPKEKKASDEGHNLSGEQQAAETILDAELGRAAGIAFSRTLQRLPALSRQLVTDALDRGTALRVESFVRKRISPLLIAAEIRKVKEWGAFGGGASSSSTTPNTQSIEADTEGDGELHARGSVAGREVWATYTFSDVTLEIGMRLPDVFPLQTVEVEARSRIGMSEGRWRKTLLGMTTLLRAKDGTLAEAVELWRRNLDKTFQGAEECPICYSVLHLSTAALPRMQCRTCKNLFHSECLCKWFTKSNSSACPLCRSAF